MQIIIHITAQYLEIFWGPLSWRCLETYEVFPCTCFGFPVIYRHDTSGLVVTLKLINNSKIEIPKFKRMFKLFRGYFLKTIYPKPKDSKTIQVHVKDRLQIWYTWEPISLKEMDIFPSAS